MEKYKEGSEESELVTTADGSEESKLVTTVDGSEESKLVTTADGSNESKLAKTGDGSEESKLVTTADGSNESKLAKTGDGSIESKLAKTGDGSNESKLVTTADGSNGCELVTTADGSNGSKLVTTADGSNESKLVTTGYSSNELKVAKAGERSKVSVFSEEPRQDSNRQEIISKIKRGQTAVASNVGGTDDSTSSHVQLMEEETAVLVENLPRDLDKVLKGKLQKYFQSKRSGGGECQLISHRDSKRKAIVKFTSKQVRNSVLAKGEHVIEVSSDEKAEVHVTAFTASPATPAEPGASIDLQTSANDKSEESEKAKETPLDKSTDTPEKPKPLKETLNSYLLKFITSNEEHRSELERALEKSRCKFKALDVNTISLLPVNESITDHNEWQGSVTKMFTQFIEGYAHETITCTEKEWQEVERNNEQKKDVEVLYKNGIQLTGKSDEVKKLKQEIEDIMSEFNKGSLFTNIEPHYFELLQDKLCMSFPGVQFDMDSKASTLYLKGNARKVEDAKKYIDSSIENSDKKKCSFGSYLNDFIRKTDLNALVQMHFSDNNIKALCGFDENGIYIYSLEGYSEQAHDILNRILKDLLFLVTKKCVAVMKSEQWNVFFKKLEHTFSSGNINCIFTPSKHNDGTCRAIYIAGIAEAVEKADKDLTSYFKDNTAEEIIPLQNEALCSCIIEYMKIIKHPAFKSVSVERHDSLMDIIIMGHSEEVEKHKQSINNVVSKVNKELRKNERGVPDAKSISMFLEKYRGRNSRCSSQNQEQFASVAGASERPVATQQRPPVRLPGNRFLFVHEDDILNLNVDVIVNAANANLNHLGGLAKVLSDAGGTVIQQESDSYVRKHGKVPTGELAITGPGHLPCKKVFHAVGPAWGDYRRNTSVGIFLLRKVITNALKKADEEGFKSIAIPAISAGIFSFPLDICSKEIWHAIFEYCKMTHDCPKTLTDIHIVDINDEFIYKLRKTIELTMNRKDRSEEQSSKTHKMQDEEEDEGPNKKIKFACYETEDRVTAWENRKTKETFSAEMNDIQRNSITTKEGRTIQVVFGNIEDQTTEVIVNSTFIEMKLDIGGATSAALLRKAGPALQDELNRKNTYRIGHGDIISTDTSKCRLSCKKVYHIAVQPVKIKGSVDKMTLDCLKKAHKEKVTSISFPALGTGNLNCPPQQVARAMLSAAIQFNKEHKDEILQLIQFVILRSKPDIFKAFENEISSSISDSEARAPNLKQEERFQTGAEHNKKLFKIQGITVELCSGDITQEKTDAIVNSTDTSMSVTSGISSAILKAAGHTIRDEFSKEHPKLGDIVVTTAGQLECKYILHIAGLQGNIEQTCSRILHECQKKNIKSVSFPAFGTGNANLSPRNVASGMLNAIHAFAKENKPTIVTNIRIVFVENSLLNVFQDVFHGRIH
ncbi:protein mono-ADP-ribosyltransferase PARP14-like [Petromyzon marinus]|uniref:protein mono-ADP-ribosyltransferase PARP14-like n=1 Tax=Petromyzon marinus TaxID=7757 RepID=UPI003F6F5B06